MQIIDFHNHIYPDAIAGKASKSISDFYGLEGGGMDGTVDTLLRQGSRAGISHYVVLPVGLKPNHVRHINQFIVDQVARHPQFTGFGTVHAAMEDIEEETQFICGAGLKGIKTHPDTQLFAIDDERLFPMYDLAQGNLIIMPHMGDTRYTFSRPERLKHVLELFPGLQVVATHLGGYSMPEIAMENLYHTDCVFDVSSSLMFMEKEQAVKLIRRYGPDRLVYATDYPLWDPVTEMERFLQLGLKEDELEKIFWRTPARLLELDKM